MNFQKKKKTGKKSGKFSPERKNGREEGKRENFRKIKIFSEKPDGEKIFRKSQKKQDSFRKKGRNGMMGRAGPGKNGRNFSNFQERPQKNQDFRFFPIFPQKKTSRRMPDFYFFRLKNPFFIFPAFRETDRNLFFQSRLFRSRSLSRSEIFCRAYTAPFMVRMLCIPISI